MANMYIHAEAAEDTADAVADVTDMTESAPEVVMTMKETADVAREAVAATKKNHDR